ncbi:hypothetical protein QJS10_CPA06g02291 [Acorus calamus]|uniref:Transmembrane protein 131-like N-terminal domain-containing protein n=1 Tax=Acorus calamus TaxID=4465 RepID=A0AAV9ENB3_ACOCL|nr:hypothetical protein QJS10_CPA06g02291 [Acorus calamus]
MVQSGMSFATEKITMGSALSCILLYLTLSGPCSMKCPLFIYVDALQEFVEYDASVSFGHEDGCHEDVLFGGVRSTHLQDDSPSFSKSNKICANSNHFCFLSTLSCFNVVDQCKGTFSAEPDNMVAWTTTDASHPPNVRETNSSWMPGYAAFVLSNGKVMSCSLSSTRQDTFSLGNKKDEQSDFSSCDQPLLPKIWKLRGQASELEEDSEQVGFDFLDGNSLPRVEISPPSLEWGTRELYVPSVAFLNIKNSYSDSALHLYEPFSTDPQFYAYNFVEMSLEPGETSSIALVFLPRLLGRSSAHLVLQTSLGGFVIHASGLAVESPYGVGPLIDFDVSSDGHLRKNISLFNPFDGILYVEEVSAWIAVSSENTSHSAHVACKTDDSQSSASMNFNDVLDGKGNKMSLMGVKPKGNWEINPLDRETFVEISIPAHIQGSIFGAFCMRLKTFSKEIPDTIVLPIEVDVSSTIPQFSSGSISVFFEFLGPGDAQGPASFSLSLLNGASHLLRVVDIIEASEGMKLLHVRFMKGLILYPETTTRIASVTYAPLIDTEFSDHDIQVSLGCKLLVITNDSTSPQIEIPCKDFVNRCSRNQHGSTSNASGNSCVELGGECAKKPRNTRTESLGNIDQNLSQTKSKLLEVAEADELILRNWRSHKTMSGISVLEDREIQFPVVQVGTRRFKWITVNNPSEKPVLMQLILNSGTIIDQCKDSDEASVPFVSRFVHNDSADMSDGFLLPKSAITEAYVHPLGQALFGPIIFQPYNQCVWRSSLLIRNNLTGVEWLPVQGVGGSHSLVLHEGSNPVQRLEFNLDLPLPLNISPQKYMFTMESTGAACSRPLSKELYAINTGDLPVEVVRLDVSGSFCGLDGFLIHTCKGFSLEPGESMRLLISYQTDFSAAIVHRDLELAMATGILVIPMRANLSLYMLGLCRKSFFWTILRKLALVVIVSASITLMLFCRILPHTLSSGMEGCFLKNDNSIATISQTKKTSRLHRNPRNARSLNEVQKTEVSQYPDCSESRDRELEDKQVRDIAALDHQKDNLVSSPTESMVVTEHTISESPPTNNLTVKIMKEKVRRRKKRNAGVGKGFAGKFEVSSSQSGNSTPSSPLSPHTTCTPRRMCPLSPDTPEQPFAKAATDISIDKEKAFLASMETILPEPETSKKCYDGNWLLAPTDQPTQPRKISKPVLLPSATFPVMGWRAPDVKAPAFLTSTSAIAPHARAPGSKLSKDDSIKSVERRGIEEEFTYDIWGNHFSEFNLLGNTNESSPGRSVISPRRSDSWEGDSQSFFARGPLVLM